MSCSTKRIVTGCVCKIISKVVLNRLGSILIKVVGPFQSTFLSGINMLDSVVIANEAPEDAKKSKRPTIVFKAIFSSNGNFYVT